MQLKSLLFIVSLAATLSLTATEALAHHDVSQFGIAWTEPVTYTELDLQTAEYDLGANQGNWAMALVSGEFTFLERISLGVQIPAAYIDDSELGSGMGLSDLTLTGKVRLYSTPHGGLIISAGALTELPTGDEDLGLGSGHFELAPLVTFSSAPIEHLIIHGSLINAYSLGGGHEHGASSGEAGDGHDHDHDHDHDSAVEEAPRPHGSLIAPHADHELSSRLGFAWVVNPIYLGAHGESVFQWSEEDLMGPVTVGSTVGWRPLSGLRLELQADVPVTSTKRFDWKTGASAAWIF